MHTPFTATLSPTRVPSSAVCESMTSALPRHSLTRPSSSTIPVNMPYLLRAG